MLAFKVAAFGLEPRAAFLVDRSCHRIGKMAGLPRWVIGRRHANSFHLDHPAGAETRQDRIDLPRDFIAFQIGRALTIRPGKIPARHERAVLQQDDAISDQSRIGQQVGERRFGIPELLERDHGRSMPPPRRGCRPVGLLVADMAQINLPHHRIGLGHQP